MDADRYKRLKEVIEQLAVETDRDKYLRLVREANQLFASIHPDHAEFKPQSQSARKTSAA
jgi:hypothetical protein